ncbi:hypothetical protein G6F65_019753 [Rhizopus arrhizus]|nr:hypothetical protein G6F68_016685 [Rhizopus microsporus]KAG1248191.1 hypothetical protein G6F65_019753 [Rhizopus arrhizus]
MSVAGHVLWNLKEMGAFCARATAGNPSAAAPATAAKATGERAVATIAEAFLSPMTPADNIDSPAAWRAPDGALWLIATAKATDKLVVYDGSTGQHLRDVGSSGTAKGQC